MGKLWLSTLVLAPAVLAAAASHGLPAKSRDGAIARWESLRFGAFVHYNMNTYGPGTDDYFGGDCVHPEVFHPTHLDVAGWVRAFKEAGMGYAVLTTRHLGGFALWNSATTDYKAPIDIVAEFVAECRRQGVAPGLYYLMGGGPEDRSSCPVRGRPFDRDAVMAQLTELTTGYGEIPYFWIDMMDWRPEDLGVQEVYDLIKSHQPSSVVIFNQHAQPGTHLHYFPTDVINGEETPPPESGYRAGDNRLETRPGNDQERRTDENAGYRPGTFYLPFEYSFTGQIPPDETPTTPVGSFHDTLWFTHAGSRLEPARNLYVQARAAYDRGASNVLLSGGPDPSGSVRAEDAAGWKLLGSLIDGDARLELERGSWVTQVDDLGPAVRAAGELGCRLRVGPRSVTVRALGRFRAIGNAEPHRLVLSRADGAALAEATWTPRAPDLNGFAYAPLAQPLKLQAGGEYLLTSSESNEDAHHGTPEEPPRFSADGAIQAIGPCLGPLSLAYSLEGPQTVAEWDFTRPGAPSSGETSTPDLSGHGNTAFFHRIKPGADGALLFDGKQSHLSVAQGGFLSAPRTLHVSARIRPDRADSTRNILAHGYTLVPPREVFLRIREGRYEVGTWNGRESGTAGFAVPPEDLGRWVELEGDYDGARWTLIRNGKTIASVPDARGVLPVPADWAIGGCARGLCMGGETRGFSGSIARVSMRCEN